MTPGELDRLIEGIGEAGKNVVRVPVENKGRILLLDPYDVVFCKAEKRKIAINTRNNRFTCYGVLTLNELETILKLHPFFRTHRAYLVNLSYVKEVVPWFNSRYLLNMSDKESTEIPVSRNRAGIFKKKIGI